MIKPDPTITIPDDLGAVHFIGIGGSGMSGIARMMLAEGVRVSGSDRSANDATRELETLGARIAIGHDARHLEDADTVVVTSALWPENPELLEARRRGLYVLHRSQALVWLTRSARVVAVAGAHGKTTSTGMIATALTRANVPASFVNGGVIAGLDTSSALGRGGHPEPGDLFVVEADESDGSFLFYDTSAALITNVDADHLDHYGTQASFEDAFVEFADSARELVVVSSDDPGAVAVTQRLSHPRVMTFGEAEDATVRIVDVDTSGLVSFTLVDGGERRRVQLKVPGRHNALNAAGAYAVLTGLGLDPDAVVQGLEAFTGTKRRFELHAEVDGVRVFDDYAHHPSEVRAALTAARDVVGDGRIIAVHQPHLYSRTQRMAGEFAEVYERTADHTIVLDVCGAREDPIEGVTGELVSRAFADPARVHYEADWQAASDYAARVAQPGDFVITLGCGDVYRMIPQLIGSLEREHHASARLATAPEATGE